MTHHRFHAVVSLLPLALAGCPSPMAPPPEEPMIAAPEAPRIPWLAAGTPDITPPQIPWLTDESACPDGWGWTEVAPGVNGCDPYPTGYIADCGPTGAHFPGEAGCRDLDSGDTEWPSDLPATNVLYVREGASGGDGTRELPFATLPEALAAAVEGTTIALAPGRYDSGSGAASVTLPGAYETLSRVTLDGVHIRGTSVALTTVFSTRPRPPDGGPGDFAMIVVEAANVEVSDLRFESPHPAVEALAGASVTVRRAILDETLAGLAAGLGGVGVFEDIIARGWTGLPAVFAWQGGHITLRRAVMSANVGFEAVSAQGPGSTAEIEDLAFIEAGTLGARDGGDIDAARIAAIRPPTAMGLAGADSHLHLQWLHWRSVLNDAGGLVLEAGTRAELEDVVLVGGFPDSTLIGGAGQLGVTRAALTARRGHPFVLEGEGSLTDIVAVDAAQGIEVRSSTGHLTLARAEIAGTASSGILAHLGATLVATDLLVHDIGAVALNAVDASLELERASIDRAQAGVLADDYARVDLTDVAIRDITTTSIDYETAGLLVTSFANMSATRVSIARVPWNAVTVIGGGLQLTDASIREFRGPPGRSAGIVIRAYDRLSTLTRVEVGDGRGIGVLVGRASVDGRLADIAVHERLEDVWVHDVEPDTDGGNGLGVIPAGNVTGERVAVTDIGAVGVWVPGNLNPAHPSTTVTLSDLNVERIGTPAAGGAGVFTADGVDLTLTRFAIREALSVGLMSRPGPHTRLANGVIATTPTCVSSEAPLDLSSVLLDACGNAPVTWIPPE